MIDLATPADAGVLAYAPAYKRQRQRRCLGGLLVTLGLSAATASLSLCRPELLAPWSAFHIILAVGGLSALWLYRLIELHACRVEIAGRGLIFRRPFRAPRRLAWEQIQLLCGDCDRETLTLHLRNGAAVPLPAPLAAPAWLWAALERYLPDRVDAGARALLRGQQDDGYPPLLAPGQLPDPATLAPPAPRRVAWTRALWFSRCLMLGFLAMFAALLLSLHASQTRYQALTQRGLAVQGTVTGWHCGLFSVVPTYVIRYRFTCNGVGHEGESYVPARLYQAVPVGALCLVTYLPEDPAVNCQGSAPERLQEQMVGSVLCVYVLLPILAGAALVMEGEVRRQRRLVRTGAVAAAQVLEYRRPQGLLGGKAQVRYRFETPDGELLLGEARLPRSGLAAPGATVPVVYDPAQPRRNLPLAACTWVRLLEA